MNQLSITDQFEEQDSLVSWFTSVLTMTVQEQDVFYDDGFGSMKDICLEYRHDVQGFKDYLKGKNKTMASRRTDNSNVRLSPILMNQLVGVVHYFNMCVCVYITYGSEPRKHHKREGYSLWESVLKVKRNVRPGK